MRKSSRSGSMSRRVCIGSDLQKLPMVLSVPTRQIFANSREVSGVSTEPMLQGLGGESRDGIGFLGGLFTSGNTEIM